MSSLRVPHCARQAHGATNPVVPRDCKLVAVCHRELLLNGFACKSCPSLLQKTVFGWVLGFHGIAVIAVTVIGPVWLLVCLVPTRETIVNNDQFLCFWVQGNK